MNPKIIDISRELMTAPVYPGDPPPELTALCRISWGDVCNTSVLRICAHAGTHMDAPLHFVPDGEDISELPLDVCIGECTVISHDGILLGDQAERIMDSVKGVPPYSADCERLLIKGRVSVSTSAAFVFASSGIKLLGVEPQSVSENDTAAAHRELLCSGMALLEGLDLSKVEEGRYFLFAAPVKIAGCDGAPVRAVLIKR